MSIFYCDFHGRLEDSDEVGFNERNDESLCDEGIDVIIEEYEKHLKEEPEPREEGWNPYYPDNPYWEGVR